MWRFCQYELNSRDGGGHHVIRGVRHDVGFSEKLFQI